MTLKISNLGLGGRMTATNTGAGGKLKTAAAATAAVISGDAEGMRTVYDIDLRTLGNITLTSGVPVTLTDPQNNSLSWVSAGGNSYVSSEGMYATNSSYPYLRMQNDLGLDPFGRSKRWRLWVAYSTIPAGSYCGLISTMNGPPDHPTNTGGSNYTQFPDYVRDPYSQVWGPSFDGRRTYPGSPFADTTNVIHVIEMNDEIAMLYAASGTSFPLYRELSLFTHERAQTWQRSWVYGEDWGMGILMYDAGRVTRVRLQVAA